MMTRKYTRGGYTDLGPIQIPPRPQTVVLTDRDTGQEWAVSFNSTLPTHLSITDDFSTIERLEGVTRYAANEGPVMDEDGQFILMIRNSHIGLEYRQFPIWETAADTMPPYARQTRAQRELIIDTTNPDFANIGYNE